MKLIHSAITPTAGNGWIARFENHQADLDRIQPDILFIGDSLTESFLGQGLPQWEKMQQAHRCANLGIGGDRIENVLWRILYSDLKSPWLCVLLAGTNNMGRNTEEQIVEGMEACVVALRAKLPSAHIAVVHLLPRQATADDATYQKLLRVNRMLDRLAGRELVLVWDFSKLFLVEGGHLHPERMKPDHVHIESEGYRVWADALLNKIATINKTETL